MTELLLRKNVLIVKNFLFNFDKNIQLIELSKTANTAIEAAKSLNKEVGSIVKSLVRILESPLFVLYDVLEL